VTTLIKIDEVDSKFVPARGHTSVATHGFAVLNLGLFIFRVTVVTRLCLLSTNISMSHVVKPFPLSRCRVSHKERYQLQV
jgi:hypothetical protein